MNTMKKTAAGAVLGGALLAAGGLGLAHAAPPAPAAQSVVDDGKINVTVTADGHEIGVIQDVSLENAQSLVNSACANAGITAEAFRALDTNGTPVPGTCAQAGVDGGLTFTFAQNQPGNSELAPGQNKPVSPNSTPSPTPSAR
jgi:hypothetical protein